MAAACIHIMNLPKDIYDLHTQPMLSHINVGCGHDITIRELAEAIAKTVGYNGNIEFDECAISPSSPAAQVLEVTNQPSPQTVWQLQISGAYAYRAFRLPSLYPGVQW